MTAGSSPSTRCGVQPKPTRRLCSSSEEIRAEMVGLALLHPFRCRIGSTAPSRIRLRNLFECSEPISGPVSASAGKRELFEELAQPVHVLRLVRIDLGVAALEIRIGQRRRRAMSRTGDVDRVQIVFPDEAIEMDPHKALTR